jgi:hypothetical protein
VFSLPGVSVVEPSALWWCFTLSWNGGRLKMISLYEKIKYFFSKSTQVQIIICTCVLFEKKICHQLHHCRVLVKHPIASAYTHHYTSTIMLPSCSWTSSSPHNFVYTLLCPLCELWPKITTYLLSYLASAKILNYSYALQNVCMSFSDLPGAWPTGRGKVPNFGWTL